ncbi:MAG: M6 family metalloprotease domain-containing protein, partial [Candidatus Cloacimonetes bacterium]|nr:M6 family metalloprotease domain-containing protein [Candidatus Cloacimonadota bacterium]
MSKLLPALLITGLLLLGSGALNGAYLRFEPQELYQPDGSRLDLFASGDEYHNWLHDKDGYTVRQNSKGWYVYLDKDSRDELIFTDFVVGRDNPARANLSPWLNISAEKMYQIRERAERELREIGGGRAPTSGTINNLVIFIRFSDQTEFGENISTYSSMFNGTTGNTMQNYFSEVSYGTLNVTSSFYPTPTTMVVSWQDTVNPRNYYVPYSDTNTIGYVDDNDRRNREHTLLVNAVNGVSSQISASLNLDGDNDGKVDNVCFIIKGATTAWATLLWPHRWALYSHTVNINGKRVYDYNFQLSNSLASSGVGVLCHEMFHSLGAPDLYHYTSNGISPVGSWDIMESNQNPPQHMCAYMKYKYGRWIASIPTLNTTGTYSVNVLTSSTNQCYRINSPNSATEYFVVEFRKKTGTFENSLPGSGMIIYRINPAYNGNASGPPDEVYAFRLNGTPSVNGTVSSANFSTETGRISFNNSTNPYCFLTDGSLGGISISAVGSSAGTAITFTYTLENAPRNLTGMSINSSAVLNWQSPAQGTPASYKVFRNGSFLASTTNLTYTDVNVIIGNSYTYYVTAVFANPSAETSPSNSIQVLIDDISSVIIGTETQTNKGLPIEPYYGYTYSQSIMLQSEINITNKSITRIAWNYNGNSAWTDAIKIYMGHTSLTSFAGTSSWIPLNQLTLVYDGNITTSTTAGWIYLTLNTPFAYNNTQNLVIAVDENTSGYHSSSDEFYCSTVSGNRSLHFYSDSTNPDPASPPTTGNYLYLKTFIPNTMLTFSTFPLFAVTPAAIDFGSVMANTVEYRTVRVTNSGNGTLVISNVSMSNNSFGLNNVPTLPVSLSGGQYFEFQVRYYPKTAATHSALLNITDNLARVVNSVSIAGSSFDANITTFPWSFSFDEWVPLNWSLAGGTRNWAQYNIGDTGNKCGRANLWIWPVPNNAVLITPPLRPSKVSVLSFKWSHLYHTTYPNDSLKVYYSTNRSTWSLLWQKGNTEFNSADGAGNTTPGSFVTAEVALPSSHTEQAFFIKFEAISGYGPDIFLDDIAIKALPFIATNATSYTYGDVAIGTSATQVMTITNNGEFDLTGYFNTPNGYTATETGRNDEPRNYVSFTIAAGNSRSYDLTFTPVNAQNYNYSFLIYSNANNQATRLMRVYGTGYLPARLDVTPDACFLMTIFNGNAASQIQLSNIGNQTLNYSITVTEPIRADVVRNREVTWLSLNTYTGNLNIGQSMNITASFNASGLNPGTHLAVLNISSNDPVNPIIQIPIEFIVTIGAPNPQISRNGTGIYLSWQAVPGANAYRVY